MNQFQKFVDENLVVIRHLPTAYFLVGTYLLARYYYIFAKFNSIQSIPSGVYKRQIHLKGLVSAVKHTGELEIFHMPKVRVPFQAKYGDMIKISFPVQHTGQSIQWVNKNIHPGERITFIPVKPILEDTELLAIIYKHVTSHFYF
ncbi:unnamed protein product [Schistosoma turkestanicum]|nr:unnamed protein product [Schistosoma turkestanicum]